MIAVEAMSKGSAELDAAKNKAISQMNKLKAPLSALTYLTGLCLLLDGFAVMYRIVHFRHLAVDEIAPSILHLLLAMVFTYIDLSAVCSLVHNQQSHMKCPNLIQKNNMLQVSWVAALKLSMPRNTFNQALMYLSNSVRTGTNELMTSAHNFIH